MDAALEKLSKKIENIENYLKSLIEVNLELIQEEEAEDWEKRAVEERREDEFLDWDVAENEL